MELTTGTLFLMVANILQSTLTALNRQQTVLVGWSAGVVAMIAVFAVPLGTLTTAALASIVGPAVTTVVMAADILRATKRGPAKGSSPGPAENADLTQRHVSSR
jgi:O-antigen/teichoic acid export membrane protein